ncbi:CheR family methyltransferase [Vibrio cincinnatiensis]|uniref:CheR family methyltransferase n=1 Tax=Vibrio cincinnatiensis TaxID=675 RepID=UPI001EE0B174|nr:protein-glutamate O-methyltransferase CheR [Vibrio cincinnatiensis]MCG3732043.1 protein-glutamate O-methyltransferase CheR [Vibrio cincinnatiensis]MCG3739754.1 protein-glutamate O-methyltransferase CheR [Vibrio cincinnatiensis]
MPFIESVSRECSLPQNLSDQTFVRYQRWLYEKAGIYLNDGKKSLVIGRLSARLQQLGLSDWNDYFDFFALSAPSASKKAEQQVVIDLLTTNETYFFREEAHFSFIQQSVIPEYIEKPLRCWSAASSSGEEAYSLAMLLMEHCYQPWQILATDISSRVLDIARRGVYPLSRSTNIPLHYLQKYCLKGVGDKANGFKVSRTLREKVNFQSVNLQDNLARFGHFDLILLRNVMIYFDAHSKQRVIENIQRQLNVGGYLFIGHAETLQLVRSSLKLLSPSIYQKV